MKVGDAGSVYENGRRDGYEEAVRRLERMAEEVFPSNIFVESRVRHDTLKQAIAALRGGT